MRLIDVDILDKALTALRFTADGKLAHWGDRKDWYLHGSEIEMLIANAPTIEAEPVRHGRWIDKGDANYYCSECDGAVRHNYPNCPFCRTKMDKGEADT